MNTKLLALVLALLVQYSTAHTYLSSVNGNDEFDAIRPERPTGDRNAPITNVLAGDMTCGWLPYASQPANRALPVVAGSNVTLQYYHDGPSPSDDIIESSHRGPCIIYMAADNGQQSPSWFKIWEYGLDASNKFCVDYLLKNGLSGAGKGKISVRIPTYLPSGKYLMRTEIIALHQGDVINGAQFYINCVELSVTNAATSDLVSPSTIPTVKFPGAYSSTDGGIYYNLYQASLPPYTIPGPSVFTPPSSSSSPSPSAPSTKAPASTPAVVTAPTTTPVTTNKYIKIQIHPSSSQYWLGVAILDGVEDTDKVEFQGSGTYKKGWNVLTKTDYGYWVFGSGVVTLPLSLRLTSSSGKVLELDDIISTQVGGTVISTNVQYSSSTPATVAPTPATVAPTPATVAPTPATVAPTPATVAPAPATVAPTPATSAPSTTLKIDVHSGSSQWWFAVALTGATQPIQSVELKDSNPNNIDYATMTKQEWGYWVYHGAQLTPPLSLRITATSGASIIVGRVPATEAIVDSDTSF